VDAKGERSLRETLKTVSERLLPDVIRLTDAFGFTDWELDSSVYSLYIIITAVLLTSGRSALGRYDGDVYQALWDKAQEEPLNKLVSWVAFGRR